MLAGRRLGRDRIEPPHRRRLAYHASEPQIGLQTLLCHQTPSAISQWPTVFLTCEGSRLSAGREKFLDSERWPAASEGTMHLSDGLFLGPLWPARLDLS